MDYTFLARPSIVVFAASILLSVVYLIGLAFYRLYLSPLAKFPGPKLAALSQWYEFYYDVVHPGQFVFQIQKLHKKYGPIVRITPFELHVEDSDYWEDLYARHTRHDKYKVAAQRFGTENILFTTPEHNLHATRRAVLNPMFSKRSIAKLEPFLKERVQLLCKGVLAMKESGEVLNLLDAYTAFTGDVILEYCFGFCDNHLGSPGFKTNFHEAFVNLVAFGALSLQFPILNPILQSLPDAVTEKLVPAMHLVLVLRKTLKDKVIAIMNGEDKTQNNAPYPTIFHEVLESNLPSEEKTLTRLDDEAMGTIGAGVTTVAWALINMSFHLINNPSILKKLQTELKAAIPDLTVEPDLPQLEKLPYLSACIQEGIRLSYGLAVRHARISQDKATKYRDWTIPAGTPVSMTIIDVHHDEHIYPNSRSFIPERWLGNPKTEEGESLSRYFVSFGKGSRSCLGINLAYAEIYHVAAAMFRRFEFELYETDFSDLELKHDFFIPVPRQDSKGVRVKVTAALS